MKSIYKGVTWVVSCILLLSCTQESTDKEPTVNKPLLVEVSAIYDAENDRHLFQTETDTIPAGWTTFRLVNKSPMVHFIFLDLLPDGKTSQDLLAEVSTIFQEASYLLMEGKEEEAMGAYSKLPDWFSEVEFRGAAGLVSPGKSTETTVFMKPGNHVMECYIKTADGTFHYQKGMARDLHVTADTTDAQAPQSPTIEITTTDEGLDIEGEITPGDHLVKVNFEEENPGMIAKDVHVAKLSEGDNLDEIATWLDFNNAQGLVSTANNPGPTTFIGGTHEFSKGEKAYFKVQLEPGRYAWVTEQPVSKSIVREFTVPNKNE